MGKVRSKVDLGRLSEAASRPGVDPRRWLAKGIVQDLAYDPEHGLFADVQLQPDGDIETVLVGTEYAGDDFGTYWPIKVEDVVLIAFPSGDPAEGGFIVSKMWSGSEKPPKELSAGDTGTDASDLTNDPTTRIEDGATLRIVGKAGANVKIELDGNATYEIIGTGNTTVKIDGDAGVRLGEAPWTGVARLNDTVTATGSPPVIDPPPDPPPPPAVPFQVWAAAVVTACGAIPAVVPPLDPTVGFISSASSKTRTE